MIQYVWLHQVDEETTSQLYLVYNIVNIDKLLTLELCSSLVLEKLSCTKKNHTTWSPRVDRRCRKLAS